MEEVKAENVWEELPDGTHRRRTADEIARSWDATKEKN